MAFRTGGRQNVGRFIEGQALAEGVRVFKRDIRRVRELMRTAAEKQGEQGECGAGDVATVLASWKNH